jgi:hypothetical protein
VAAFNRNPRPQSSESAGDCVALREREEQRWTASEPVLSLPGSAMVKVELVELLDGRPLLPAM